jgi:hypothetical protein
MISALSHLRGFSAASRRGLEDGRTRVDGMRIRARVKASEDVAGGQVKDEMVVGRFAMELTLSPHARVAQTALAGRRVAR